jgi:hypothetical protein
MIYDVLIISDIITMKPANTLKLYRARHSFVELALKKETSALHCIRILKHAYQWFIGCTMPDLGIAQLLNESRE